MLKLLNVCSEEDYEMYPKYTKRLLDIVISILSIIIISPLYLMLSIAVLISMGRPILFSQERIGKDEKHFTLYKFRSMTNAKDKNGNLLDEQHRLTKFGKWLRSSSLDELPELFQILAGHMSFVGPRPLPVLYLPYFHDDEKFRHTVRGGLIPPDSLSGKAYTTWEEQFKYDNRYLRNISLLMDIKVIIKTFDILFRRMRGHYGSEFREQLNVYRADELSRMESSLTAGQNTSKLSADDRS